MYIRNGLRNWFLMAKNGGGFGIKGVGLRCIRKVWWSVAMVGWDYFVGLFCFFIVLCIA